MKNFEVRRKFSEAYKEIVDDAVIPGWRYRNHFYDYMVREQGKFESCGQTLVSPYTGYEVRHFCRRPVCPSCSTYWGRTLGKKFVARYPDAGHGDFRMITMVLGITSDLDDGFNLFKARRKTLNNGVGYRRTRGLDRAGWRDFGIAGALEFDFFEAQDFGELGPLKRAQYLELGFDPITAKGWQWVVTVHGIAHVGRLGGDTIKTGLRSAAPVVHIQELYDWQPLDEAAENVGGYSAKVAIETSLDDGESREWLPEVLKEYILATKRNSHGRQGFRVLIGPKSNQQMKKKSTHGQVVNHDYGDDHAMPVII
jgi:hypothetical protein